MDMSPELILSALDDVLNDVGVHESVKQHLISDTESEETTGLTDFS